MAKKLKNKCESGDQDKSVIQFIPDVTEEREATQQMVLEEAIELENLAKSASVIATSLLAKANTLQLLSEILKKKTIKERILKGKGGKEQVRESAGKEK